MAPNKSEEEINGLVNCYSAMIFRICYCILGNSEDARDAVQETFLKYLTKAPEFNSEEHRKAWLIKVSANISKNMLMFRRRREAANLDDFANVGINERDYDNFEFIMSLPAKHKIVMTLYYVEGYTSKEIAGILNISEEAVRKRLEKGRKMIKKEIETEEML